MRVWFFLEALLVIVPKKIYTAKTFFPRLIGLMGMKKWPSAHRGILFPGCGSVHTFFTFLKPDLLFIDARSRILKIFISAGPWKVFWGPKGSAHCLELPPGSVRSKKLRVGDKIRFKRGSRFILSMTGNTGEAGPGKGKNRGR